MSLEVLKCQNTGHDLHGCSGGDFRVIFLAVKQHILAEVVNAISGGNDLIHFGKLRVSGQRNGKQQ